MYAIPKCKIPNAKIPNRAGSRNLPSRAVPAFRSSISSGAARHGWASTLLRAGPSPFKLRFKFPARLGFLRLLCRAMPHQNIPEFSQIIRFDFSPFCWFLFDLSAIFACFYSILL
jgi:hypothetical protein